jgi:hypothetical protein
MLGNYVGFEVLTVEVMALVCYLLYAGFLLSLFFITEDGGDMLLQNIGRIPVDYSALYARR